MIIRTVEDKIYTVTLHGDTKSNRLDTAFKTEAAARDWIGERIDHLESQNATFSIDVYTRQTIAYDSRTSPITPRDYLKAP